MTDGEALGAPNPSVTYVVPPGSERLLNNVRFYEAFGSSFFFHKLRSLEVALTPAGIEAAVSGDAESGTPEGRAAFARDIRAEIHFTAIHNIETVIYLMLSVYSRGVPMVIYMNLAKDVKQSVQDLKEEKFSKLSKQSTTDKRFFYRQCLLTGLEETLPVISQVLSDSIDMLETCVNIYVIGLEAYNAYKHGLRMDMGAFALDVAEPGDNAAVWNELLSSADSSQYLVKKRTGNDPSVPNDHKIFLLEDHLFQPETSAALIRILRVVMRNIVNTRLDVLHKRDLSRLAGFQQADLDLVRETRQQIMLLSWDSEGPLTDITSSVNPQR